MKELAVREWAVYVNEKYTGTVFETSEKVARLAALSKFDIGSEDNFSVLEVSAEE